MTEPAFVLVDTNVLLDVTAADPTWLDWSARQMSRFPSRLVINSLIYSELCYQAESIDEVESMVSGLGLLYRELPREALYLAAQAFRIYRQHGGTRTAPLADFLIGAHALAEGYALLTRDVARYRSYFPDVTLICP